MHKNVREFCFAEFIKIIFFIVVWKRMVVCVCVCLHLFWGNLFLFEVNH